MSADRPLRVLALAAYPESAPSTRVRISQFIPRLAELGVEVALRPFLDELRYGSVRRGGSWPGARLAGAGRELAATLRTLPDFDVVWVQRGVVPGLDGMVLRAIKGARIPLVFDFDDAVFLPQERGRAWVEILRRPGPTTRAFCRAATVVLAGNSHLASYARGVVDRGEDAKVRTLPSVVDTTVFQPIPVDGELIHGGGGGSTPTLGWVGTDTTIPYLESLAPALAVLAERVRYRLLVVAGDRAPHLPAVEVESVRWTPEGEVGQLQRMDVGLYPLDDTPWSRGKCGFKAIQYLACGIPCVASPVGVLPDIVRHGATGLLASSPEEWIEACASLLADSGVRERMGAEGRTHVQACYSVEAALPRLVEALQMAARVGHG